MLIALALLLPGCETLRTGVQEPEPKEETPLESAREMQSQIEEIRNRRAREAVRFASGDPSEVALDGIGEAVEAEWKDLALLLFGDADLQLSSRGRALQRIARFDIANGEVVFQADRLTEDEGQLALALAINEALEFQHFGPLEGPTSVDQWFAREVIGQSGPQFVSALQRARAKELDLNADSLGKRPELSGFIPEVGKALGEAPEEVGQTYSFEQNLSALLQREGLALGAALFRAGGWPAVEWGRIEPPTSSLYAVRPDRWFRGEGHGQWEWPESYQEQRSRTGWELTREGRVGPALLALWLSGVVDRRAARSIYSGYLADAYRLEESASGERLSLHWVSAWQTPHEAQEIAEAAERALRHYHQTERPFQVTVEGVTVAVVVYSKTHDPDLMSQESILLAGARFGIYPDEEAPIQYVPTLLEEYMEVAAQSVLDNDRWLDEAAGWQVDVEALQGYQLQKSDEAHVRWFAIHRDSTLVQWTTELLNPLRPDFASPAYIESMKEIFKVSMAAEEEPYVQIKEEPVNPLVEMDVMGTVEGRPLALKVWQWSRGDVLVTFSVQGPEESFGDRLTEAEAVLRSLEEYKSAVGEGRRSRSGGGEDEGIIEFRLEEE